MSGTHLDLFYISFLINIILNSIPSSSSSIFITKKMGGEKNAAFYEEWFWPWSFFRMVGWGKSGRRKNISLSSFQCICICIPTSDVISLVCVCQVSRGASSFQCWGCDHRNIILVDVFTTKSLCLKTSCQWHGRSQEFRYYVMLVLYCWCLGQKKTWYLRFRSFSC